jgi:hypothetical protein
MQNDRKSGAYIHLRQPEIKAVIECFFDDSGKENDPSHRFVCIAGYMAHDTFWWPFQPAWRHLLTRHGLPYVHLREFIEMAKDKGWDRRKQDAVLGEFIEVIKQHRLIGFGVAVDVTAWNAIPKDRRNRFSASVQEFCCMRLLRRIIDRLHEAQELEPIAVVFDRDFQYARPRLKLLEDIHKHDPRVGPRIASVNFSDSKRYIPLQAADLLAWETRRELVNRVQGFASSSRWGALFKALPFQELDYEGEFWDKELFDSSFATIEKQIAEAQAKAAAGNAP